MMIRSPARGTLIEILFCSFLVRAQWDDLGQLPVLDMGPAILSQAQDAALQQGLKRFYARQSRPTPAQDLAGVPPNLTYLSNRSAAKSGSQGVHCASCQKQPQGSLHRAGAVLPARLRSHLPGSDRALRSVTALPAKVEMRMSDG